MFTDTYTRVSTVAHLRMNPSAKISCWDTPASDGSKLTVLDVGGVTILPTVEQLAAIADSINVYLAGLAVDKPLSASSGSPVSEESAAPEDEEFLPEEVIR